MYWRKLMCEKSDESIVNNLLKQYPIYELVEFNEFTIEDKLQKNASLLMQFKDLFMREKYQLDRIETLMEKIKGDLYDNYRFNSPKTLQKNEIENYYIPRDEKFLKIKKIYNEQKVKVDFFEACAKAIEKQSWNMKNFLEAQRIK